MGYTMHQIQNCYNNTVKAYESMNFKNVPCSSIVNYSGNIYRSTDLSADNRVTVRVQLISKRENIFGFDYPVHTLSIDTSKYVNNQKLVTEHCGKFYCIDSNYFTSDLSELKNAREISLKRYLKYHSHSSKTSYLDLSKLSSRLTSYIKKAIDKQLNCESAKYTIRDIYFSYSNSLGRKLFVVIKRDDSSATESFCFNPQLLPMYISGQLA